MYNPFQKKSVKSQSLRSEKRLAKRLGGFRTPASGAIIKGDIRTAAYLIEQKDTSKSSFHLTTQILMKLCKEAYSAGKKPMLIVQFEGLKAIPNQWSIAPLEIVKPRP